MKNPYSQYQKTHVTTASRENILLMLYEACIKFTKRAELALVEKRIADKGKNVSKAIAILSELMAVLDFKVGGDLALELEKLYVFMIDKLIEGNVSNDPVCFSQVEALLKTLHTGWKEAVENIKEKTEKEEVESKDAQTAEVEKKSSENDFHKEGLSKFKVSV